MKKSSPSKNRQLVAFQNAEQEIINSTMGQLLNTANALLVSKGGEHQAVALFANLNKLAEEFPMDVVAVAALTMASNSLAGYLAFLALNTGSDSELYFEGLLKQTENYLQAVQSKRKPK